MTGGPKTAILYARVSTDEQAKHGYSLRQQIEALREYADTNGYTVLDEITDPAHSGAHLERPGLDTVRDLVEAGGVDVVLAQDRDRFAREPGLLYYLKRELEGYGCQLRSLNDRGDDSPEGKLMTGISDHIALYERAKIAERTRWGKLKKVKEGKILAGRFADFGFRFNDARDGYEVDPAAMAIISRIFHMIGTEGRPVHSVRRTFEAEGIPTPAGGKVWSRKYIRSVVFNDVYKPHSVEELRSLGVGDAVIGRLDPDKQYGLWWYNRRNLKRKPVTEVDATGERSYRYKYTVGYHDREQWIAVPVPDARILLEVVETARQRLTDNRREASQPKAAGGRFWELSGMLRCGVCGGSMRSRPSRNRPGGPLRYYYVCSKAYADEGCDHKKYHRAENAEGTVAGFVSDLLSDPDRIAANLDAAIEAEYRSLRNPDKEAETWLSRIAEIDRKQDRLYDALADDELDKDRLKARLSALDAEKEKAEERLAAVRDAKSRIDELKAKRRAVLEMYGKGLLYGLEFMLPQMRRHIYDLARLRVTVEPGWVFSIEGDITANVIQYGREAEEYARRQSDWENADGPVTRRTSQPSMPERKMNGRKCGKTRMGS